MQFMDIDTQMVTDREWFFLYAFQLFGISNWMSINRMAEWAECLTDWLTDWLRINERRKLFTNFMNRMTKNGSFLLFILLPLLLFDKRANPSHYELCRSFSIWFVFPFFSFMFNFALFCLVLFQFCHPRLNLTFTDVTCCCQRQLCNCQNDPHFEMVSMNRNETKRKWKWNETWQSKKSCEQWIENFAKILNSTTNFEHSSIWKHWKDHHMPTSLRCSVLLFLFSSWVGNNRRVWILKSEDRSKLVLFCFVGIKPIRRKWFKIKC